METAPPKAPPLQLKSSVPVLLLFQPARAGTPGRESGTVHSPLASGGQ